MKTIPRLLAILLVLGASLFNAAAQVSSNQVYVGLVSYWPLDGSPDGVTTPDVTSQSNNLTLFGGPATAPGKFGNAFSFNGTSQYLMISHGLSNTATGLPIYMAGAYSISMWVNGAAQTAKYVFTEANTTTTGPLFILQTGQNASTNSKLDVIIRGASTPVNHQVTSNSVFDGTWHHVAWVDNFGAVSVYVDGALDPKSANFNYTRIPNNAGLSLNDTVLGALVRTSVAGYFTGSIDDVALWERPLSQAEVQYVMSNSIAQPVPPLPPTITSPLAGRTNAMGDYVTLSVGAIGPRPLNYQWFKNGAAISGQTNASLAITTFTNNGTFAFSVVVSNPNGAVTNSAQVVVLPDATPNLPASLFSYWPFDTITNQNGTTNTPDLYSHDSMQLNLMAASNLVTGKFGNALAFDGATQYANQIGGLPIYSVSNYTVALWVNGLGTQAGKAVFSEASATNVGSPGTELEFAL